MMTGSLPMDPALGELTPELPGEAGDIEIGDVWLIGDRSAESSAVTPTSPSSVPSDFELRAEDEICHNCSLDIDLPL